MAGMKTDFDFCVIGAGVVGSATAYHLSNSSGSVLILEQVIFYLLLFYNVISNCNASLCDE